MRTGIERNLCVAIEIRLRSLQAARSVRRIFWCHGRGRLTERRGRLRRLRRRRWCRRRSSGGELFGRAGDCAGSGAARAAVCRNWALRGGVAVDERTVAAACGRGAGIRLRSRSIRDRVRSGAFRRLRPGSRGRCRPVRWEFPRESARAGTRGAAFVAEHAAVDGAGSVSVLRARVMPT